MADGRRVLVTLSEHVPVAQLREALGSSVTSIAPVEKKDLPTDERQLWAVRSVQREAIAATQQRQHVVVLAPAGECFATTDDKAAVEAAYLEEVPVDGCAFGGVLYAEAPELPEAELAHAASVLSCLYDLAPLRAGLRVVRDCVASASECAAAAAVVRSALAEVAVTTGERASLALTPHLVESGACDASGYALLHQLRERCRTAVSMAFGEEVLFHSGALVTRVLGGEHESDGAEAATEAASPAYCHAHVDKCAILSYDISAVLYLMGVTDPGGLVGGSFAFLDRDATERHVEVRAGRLLAFGAGVENVHRVCEVRRGERVAMALWFTLSAQHQQPPEELGLPDADVTTGVRPWMRRCAGGGV